MTPPNDSFDDQPASFLTEGDDLSTSDAMVNDDAEHQAAAPLGFGHKLIGGLVYGIAGLVVAATVAAFVSPSLAARAANYMPASLMGDTTPVVGQDGSCCSAGRCSMATDATLVAAPDSGSSCCSAAMTGCCEQDANDEMSDDEMVIGTDADAIDETEVTEVTETTGESVKAAGDTVQTDAAAEQPSV